MSPGVMSRLGPQYTIYLLLSVTIAALGPLQFGFHIAELNAPQDVITCKKKSVASSTWRDHLTQGKEPAWLPQCIPMNEAQFAALSSLYVIGGFLGALCGGPASSRWGRLWPMRITAIFFVVGATMATMAGSVASMSIGRFLSGCGAGAATTIVPLYIAEIAPPAARGLFGVVTQTATCTGIVLSQTLGYLLSRDAMWRVILVTGSFIGLAQAIGLLFVSESPIWLVTHGNSEQALHVMQRMRGRGSDISEETKSWNLSAAGPEEGERLLREERRGSATAATPMNVGFYQVTRDPLYRPAVIAVIGIMFAQQFCGINSIIMYSVSLLSGVLPVASALLTIIISIINLVITILSAPLPDRLGRKTCLLLSIAGMGVNSVLLATSMRAGWPIVSALAVIGFVAFFAIGLGPVPFMMAAELTGPEASGATQSWSLAANYFATFVVAQFFPIVNTSLNDWLGGKGWAFFIFGALAALSGAFVSWWVPETRGKKDADEVWGRVRRVE